MPQQDFNAAERQAIMRAQEMYRRATPPPNGEPVFRKQPSPPPPQFNHRPPPPPEPEFRPPPRHEPSSKPTFNNPLVNLFDGDMKLIIAMMLLLSGDGGDMLLLMALMYIML